MLLALFMPVSLQFLLQSGSAASSGSAQICVTVLFFIWITPIYKTLLPPGRVQLRCTRTSPLPGSAVLLVSSDDTVTDVCFVPSLKPSTRNDRITSPMVLKP